MAGEATQAGLALIGEILLGAVIGLVAILALRFIANKAWPHFAADEERIPGDW